MLWIFVAALAFGGVFIVLALLGHDHDVDTSGVHLPLHPHADADAGLFGLFSLRNLTWASFAFGGIGLLAVLTERSASTTWTSAIVAGLLTWALVHVVFRLLRRSEFDATPLDVAAIGNEAVLVVPFNEDGVGVVQFRSGGQYQELPARRAAEYDDVPAPQFAACRIESIHAGFAIVTPVV